MSLEVAFRDVIRRGIEAELAPIRAILQELQRTSDQLNGLTSLANRLAPLVGVKVSLPTRRPGRPAGAIRIAGKRGPRPVNDRGCALIGCTRPSRTKGYCSAHYQKYRALSRTGRLPSDWKEFAAPGSVDDIVLPRGRAGARALKETRRSRKAA